MRALGVAGLWAGGAVLLAGCGIRLEDDAPRVPLVPTRTPIPGETELVALLLGSRTLAAAASAPYAAGLARQEAVLDAALRERGVPQSLLAAATEPSGGPRSGGLPSGASGSVSGTSGGVTGTPQRADLGALAARGALDALAAVPVAEPALRTMLASLATARLLLAATLKQPVPSPPEPGALPEPAASDLLAAMRQGAYGLEIAAARSSPDPQEKSDPREKAEAALHTVRGWVLRLEDHLGAAAPPRPAAYALPLEVSDNTTARRLIRHVTGALVSTCGTTLSGLSQDPAATRSGIGWLSATARLDRSWGAPWTPFPGLT